MAFSWIGASFAKLEGEEGEWKVLDVNGAEEGEQGVCYVYTTEGVYLCGGVGEYTSSRVFFFDGTALSQLTPLLQSRCDACGIYYSKSLYIFGGYNKESDFTLRTCERLNTETGRWTPFPPMMSERRGAAVCVVSEAIYVVGGVCMNTAEYFPFEEGRWNEAEFSLPNAISNFAIYPLDDINVLVLGGLLSDSSLTTAIHRIDVNADLIFSEGNLARPFSASQPPMVIGEKMILISGREILAHTLKPRTRRAQRLSTDPGKTQIRMDQVSPMLSRELASLGIMGLSQEEPEVNITLPPRPLIFVIKRPGRDDDVDHSFHEIVTELVNRKVKVIVERSSHFNFPSEVGLFDLKVHSGKVNLLVTLGGDGTVIWAVSLFKTEPLPPILAMHMGSLGFMTYYSVEEGLVVLRSCLEQTEMAVDLKKRLDIWTIQVNGKKTHKGIALNEVVIDRGSSASLLHVDCYMDGQFFTTAFADGVMIATPAGSTAYSLAAGGSIVHPEIPCMLFTPICPHSLSFRPILFPENVQLSFVVPEDARCSGMVSIDGSSRFELQKKVTLEVVTSSYPVPFISQEKGLPHWMKQLKSTMKWNKRKKQKPLVPASNGSID